MEWAPVTRGRDLEIDWSKYLDRPIDPYLIWADLTGFAGCSAGTQRADASQRTVGLALEVERGKTTLSDFSKGRSPLELPINAIVSSGSSLFATASVPLNKVRSLLDSAHVKRVELGFAGLGPELQMPESRPLPPQRVCDPVVAVIDFGCAFAHERFRHEVNGDWKTRIAYLWDQSRPPDVNASWNEVADFGYGRELTGAAIDALIAARYVGGRVDEDEVYLDADYGSVDTMLTHGTHVLDLAAGAPPGSTPSLAPRIIFVQLPDFAVNDTSGGSMVTHVMDALKYIRDRVDPLAPLVVNLSYGSMAGPHDGSTILESVLDAVVKEAMGPPPSANPKRYLSIVLPAGNNFECDGHAVVELNKRKLSQTLQWHVLPEDPTDTFLELWYPRRLAGDLVVEIEPPAGPSFQLGIGKAAKLAPKGRSPIAAALHLKRASSGRGDAAVLIALAPTHSKDPARALAPSGIWRVKLSLVGKRRPMSVFAWVERDDPPIGSGAAPRQSRLLTGSLPLGVNKSSPPGSVVSRQGTCSSIANGSRTVVVGACLAGEPAITFSRYASSGPTRGLREHWPDLVAPADQSRRLFGVPAAGTRSGVVVRMNGSSVAAPQVARVLIDAFLPYKQPTGSAQPTPPAYDLSAKIDCRPHDTDRERAGRGRLNARRRPAADGTPCG